MTAIPSRILVATDFSLTAECAEKLGLRLARQLGAELHLVHVRMILEDPLMGEEMRLEIDRLMTASDEKDSTSFDRDHAARHDVNVTTHLVRSLSPADAIVETADDLDCGLIIMGTHGRRGLSHLMLGSVAERVVSSTSRPVLTVRAGIELDDDWPIHVLVSHDFSEQSAVAVRLAGAWAEALDAELTVLHVVEPVVYPELYSFNVVTDDVMSKLRDRATEGLDESLADILGDRDRNTSVLIGRAADTIVAEAAAPSIGLVVMGTRGLSGIEQFLLGSVTDTVLRRCSVPLLTVG